MINTLNNDELIKKILSSAKTIAMVGVSYIKEEDSTNIRRRPSTIVMRYLQEFGYRVIPVNPFSAGKKIYGEKVFAKLEDVNFPIDIVDVFRPSKEVPELAKQTIRIKAKILWLQYGIEDKKSEPLLNSKKNTYIENKGIKQEYQRLFLKVNPVFPALKN